jgi:hypothetical protein
MSRSKTGTLDSLLRCYFQSTAVWLINPIVLAPLELVDAATKRFSGQPVRGSAGIAPPRTRDGQGALAPVIVKSSLVACPDPTMIASGTVGELVKLIPVGVSSVTE